MTCIKYLLHLFTLIIGLSGLAILAVSYLIWREYYKYAEFIDLKVYSPPIVLMIAGSVVFILAFVGWCGTIRDSHCLLTLFASLIFIVFFLEIAIGVLGYIERENVNQMSEKILNGTIPKYYTDKKIQETWDIIQTDGGCCGVNSYNDWKDTSGLPHSCCKDLEMTATCTVDYIKAKKIPGCLPFLRDFMKSNILIIGGVCVSVALLQLIGILFACNLARMIRHEYETV